MASRRIQLRACKCQFPWTQLINIVNHDAAQNISMLHSPNPFQRCNKSFCWNLLSNELLQLFRFSFDIYYKKAINMKKWMVIWFSNRDYCSRLIEKTKTRVGFFCCLEDTCGRNWTQPHRFPLSITPACVSPQHEIFLCILNLNDKAHTPDKRPNLSSAPKNLHSILMNNLFFLNNYPLPVACTVNFFHVSNVSTVSQRETTKNSIRLEFQADSFLRSVIIKQRAKWFW